MENSEPVRRETKKPLSGGVSVAFRNARLKMGLTIEAVAGELYARGYPTAVNKLWRLENSPPEKVDETLIAWLNAVLKTNLVEGGTSVVLAEDVLRCIKSVFDEWRRNRFAGIEIKSTQVDPNLFNIETAIIHELSLSISETR
jgi:hypothetical protein